MLQCAIPYKNILQPVYIPKATQYLQVAHLITAEFPVVGPQGYNPMMSYALISAAANINAQQTGTPRPVVNFEMVEWES